MTPQIAAPTLREDNQRLRDETSVYSTRTDGPEQSQHALSADLSSARRELEVKTSLIQERDRMIASFATEVAQLKKTNVERTNQVATLRQDCGSARRELEVKTSLIQERDRMVASFTTEVAQLKKTNAEQTKQVATLRQDCENLQERCSAQAKEMSLLVEEKCVGTLKGLGDVALSSGKHEEAIACYTSAISLSSAHAVDILVKRSNARALKGSWEDALTDAMEVRISWFLWLH